GAAPSPSASPGASRSAAAPSATPRPAPTVTPSSEPSSSAAPSASLAPSFSATYRVEKGDTLLAIASRYGTTAARIRTLNALTSATLKIGQVLKIP
ncbi:MAG TPA: LysM peptidoglycan-binding domain-containing protein, partial [Candidatus Deferrimicrobium sp.]|nr:LysM peptidoglycan-binding domain-containing protein [Candidatus Deferrimicrobium sp.]